MFTRAQTCSSMVLEPRVARALPGNREEAYRAGITPRIRRGTQKSTIVAQCRTTRPQENHHPATLSRMVNFSVAARPLFSFDCVRFSPGVRRFQGIGQLPEEIKMRTNGIG